MREFAKQAVGEGDDDDIPDASLLGIQLKALGKGAVVNALTLFPGLSEVMEILTAPWRASEGQIAGHMTQLAVNTQSSIRKAFELAQEVDESRGKKRRRLEDKFGKALNSALEDVAQLGGYATGIPLRGVKDIRTFLVGAKEWADQLGQ